MAQPHFALHDRVAVITGAAQGIGAACARRLAGDGAAVALWDVNLAAAQALADELRAAGAKTFAQRCDVSRKAEVDAALAGTRQALGHVNALVNNAGIFDERKFLEVSSADFRRAYEVNLIAVATLTQEVARTMPDGGRIVNIASRAYLGAKNHPHYVASKAAVVGYTRASAMELAPRGILVNAIAPGLIDTPILRALTPERLAAQLALQPTGKAGRPEDIAQAVSFLVSAQTGFITGQVLFVDGGKSLGGSGA